MPTDNDIDFIFVTADGQYVINSFPDIEEIHLTIPRNTEKTIPFPYFKLSMNCKVNQHFRDKLMERQTNNSRRFKGLRVIRWRKLI